MNIFTKDDLKFIAIVLNKIFDANKSNIKYIKKKKYISKADIKILMEHSELEMKLRTIIEKIDFLIDERDVL
ncbi:hypothetical protein H8K00_11860 [Clostridium perfringens]|uniref:hypothetical protein n=1 Tax=Clostridium perfringens TaxID=1502 RepID=UPI0018E43428|nr:hypothetical protein [Clostridium perfringens]MBI6083065.1 hypothetical protein [Clostridium perfringens]MBO3329698.1 hypothetical protein [Clostridium perfringens]MDK0647587.1 hypothetical protein [Clostridium perfringens]MDK0850156.1 hypothetical protein [Clostridium perfringens]MDK0870679.1 hypothetical protein [Clostridium perfringens]